MSGDLFALLQQAVLAFQRGDLALAEQLTRQVLSVQPRHFDALHLLGVINACAGNNENAVSIYRDALKINGNSEELRINLGLAMVAVGKHKDALINFKKAAVLNPGNSGNYSNVGNVQKELGLFDEALASYEQALKITPDYVEAWSNRGVTLHDLKRYDEALASYEQALKLKPDYAEAWSNRGNTLHHLKRHHEALASYERALKLKPNYAEAWSNRGITLHDLKRYDEALASYEQARKIKPDFVKAWSNRGVVLKDLGRYEEALASDEQALKIDRGYAEAWSNRGNTLRHLKRYDEAIESYDKTLALRPDYSEAWSNRGVALHDLKRYEEALASYGQAVKITPDYTEAWSNRGITLSDLKRYDEALADYARAQAINPDYAHAHWNESLARLVLGQYEIGWQKYEYRWQGEVHNDPRHTDLPLWLGSESLRGRKILVWAEQGYGDAIQFCRYVMLLNNLGAEVILEVPPPLKAIMSTMARCLVIAQNEAAPHADFQCPVLSLPLAFKTNLQSIPSSVPYLSVDDELMAAWRKRLDLSNTTLNIGIACSGNPTQNNDPNRSMPLQEFAPLLDLAKLFLVQKEVRDSDRAFLDRSPQITFLGDQIQDFADSAAIIENMDLTISVCTSLAHLAGSLARPVWVLLPWAPDWRWLLDRADSPWYPSAVLFRQPKLDDWQSVISEVLAALKKFDKAAGRST